MRNRKINKERGMKGKRKKWQKGGRENRREEGEVPQDGAWRMLVRRGKGR